LQQIEPLRHCYRLYLGLLLKIAQTDPFHEAILSMLHAFKQIRLWIICLTLAASVEPAAAHHTFVTKYDPSKTVHLSGEVTSVSYVNPHIYFQIETGKGTWSVETESISVATAKGLSPAVLKVGAKVSITGWPARDGSAALGLNTITLSGGTTIKMRGTAR
jgi:hypothetical protein